MTKTLTQFMQARPHNRDFSLPLKIPMHRTHPERVSFFYDLQPTTTTTNIPLPPTSSIYRPTRHHASTFIDATTAEAGCYGLEHSHDHTIRALGVPFDRAELHDDCSLYPEIDFR